MDNHLQLVPAKLQGLYKKMAAEYRACVFQGLNEANTPAEKSAFQHAESFKSTLTVAPTETLCNHYYNSWWWKEGRYYFQ